MSPRLRYILVLLFCGIAFGSTQTLAKISVSTGHEGFGLIFWQCVMGAAFLGAVLLVRRQSIPLSGATITFALIIAVIGTVIPNATFFYSIARLPAGIMSILISTVPLMAFPIALALGMDRLSLARLAGLLCGLAGVALIALPRASLPSPEMAAYFPIALVAPFFYAVEGNFVAKYRMAGMDAIQTMCLAMVIGAALTLPIAIGTGQWVSLVVPWGHAEWALVANSLIIIIAYTTYVWLASQAGAVFAAQSTYIVTGTGITLAMFTLGESYSSYVWGALGLMVVGLALVQPRETAGNLPAEEPA